jgi:hypothetical protein
MRRMLLAAVAFGGLSALTTLGASAAPSSYTEKGSNAASLKELLAEWDQAGFNSASKPAQYHVYGRNGYVTSGPGYDTLVSKIRSAENGARQGRDRDEATDIAEARSLLAGMDRSKPADARG